MSCKSGAMLALCMGTLMAAVRRRRNMSFFEPLDAVLGRQSQPTMSGDAVNELPSKIYVPLEEGTGGLAEQPQIKSVLESGHGDETEINFCREEQTCSICLDEFQAGQVRYTQIQMNCEKSPKILISPCNRSRGCCHARMFSMQRVWMSG